MFGSELLETAIGLTLVFLLGGLACSALNELLLGALANKRADLLLEGLRRLLGDTAWSDDLLKHPLIEGLKAGPQNRLTYVPARTFVDSLLGMVGERARAANVRLEPNDLASLREAVAALGQHPTARSLEALLGSSITLADARTRLEGWFDDAMERVSGEYKRVASISLAACAGILVLVGNIDAVRIAERFYTDDALRKTVADAVPEVLRSVAPSMPTNAAPARTLTPPSTTDMTNALRTVVMAVDQLTSLKLPIGWENEPPGSLATASQWFRKLLGLILSAAAFSLGAPFWFDLLNRLVNLRAGGRPPAVTSPAPAPAGPAPAAGHR